MVNTRPQLAENNTSETIRMDDYSDIESKCSMPEVLTREQISDFDKGDLINRGNVNSQNSVDQRFLEMNKQISDLTNRVLAMTEKISCNNREVNGLQTAIYSHDTRSDKQPIRCMLNLAAFVRCKVLQVSLRRRSNLESS